MLDPAPLVVPGWVWLVFHGYLAVLLLGLLILSRKSRRVVASREAVGLSVVFVCAALSVGAVIGWQFSPASGVAFVTAYLVELSLSVDNLLVLSVLLGYFGVPAPLKHRVLFWGILGAIVIRGALILGGVEVMKQFHVALYFFGVFLILTGVRLVLAREQRADVGASPVLRFLRKRLPVTRSYVGDRLFLQKLQRLWVTPLFLVLAMSSVAHMVFAVDSVPAVLGVTTDPFLAYSSNLLAIAALPALYVALAGVIERVQSLRVGLGAMLVFIGLKMLASDWLLSVGREVPEWFSLAVIATCIATSALVSWFAHRRDRERDLLGRRRSHRAPKPEEAL
ncbi:MAG: TerC/Alx family metal homeostasis membrane protein [Bacteroidota bacterium]